MQQEDGLRGLAKVMDFIYACAFDFIRRDKHLLVLLQLNQRVWHKYRRGR
jgi:hypothetical protein